MVWKVLIRIYEKNGKHGLAYNDGIVGIADGATIISGKNNAWRVNGTIYNNFTDYVAKMCHIADNTDRVIDINL